MAITVINRKIHTVDSDTFYCGRPSPLGNPFPMNFESDRDEVIGKYENWLVDQLEKENFRVLSELNKLVSHHKKTGNLKLSCWCKPKKCHCDVIKNVLEKLIDI